MRITTITELTSSFTAINDTGERHLIDEYTRFTIFQPLSDPAQRQPGSRSLRLGRDHVNEREDGTLEIARTGERLRRV